MESACNGDQKLCSTRRENSSPESALQDGRQDAGFTEFRTGAEIPPRSIRHSESLVAPMLPRAIRRPFGVKKLSFRTPKLRFWLTISPFPRFSASNVSLDHVNPWRGNHTESACHGDRKLCSTRRENSSPGKTLIFVCVAIGTACESPIRNRHFDPNSVSGPKFHRGACVLVHRLLYPLGKTRIFVCAAIGTARKSPIRNQHFDPVGRSNVSLDHVNPEQGNHTELAYHGDRKLCSTRQENSSPELAITFRPGVGIAYVRTIRNRHSETVDRTLVSQNFVLGPKFHRRACIFVRTAIGTASESLIRNRHFDRVDRRSDSVIFGLASKFLSESVVAGCRCDRMRTPLRSNRHNFLLSYRNHL
ncbi:hypothetical protein Taro_033405 [Colocasia esculenta]|uniref:Uncharacterized protein n=1 Tax=Colocasia esculenta TaxID=4460 RepID=A0A843WCE6_COLES|nr:hypothetical protein [Colocasia esculenta]